MKPQIRQVMEKLQAPFSANDIEWRVERINLQKDKVLLYPYVTNRAIQARLDEVVGPSHWQNEFKEWREKGVICTLSIFLEGKWIAKSDGADETSFEPTKGGLSAAQKRAATQWGIGRYLYELDRVWMEIKEKGNIPVFYQRELIGYCEKPELPRWALSIEEKKVVEQKTQEIVSMWKQLSKKAFSDISFEQWVKEKVGKPKEELTLHEIQQIEDALMKKMNPSEEEGKIENP